MTTEDSVLGFAVVIVGGMIGCIIVLALQVGFEFVRDIWRSL